MKFERVLRTGVGLTLWTISGLFTVNLFIALAGADPLKQMVAVALAIALELSKVLSFRKKTISSLIFAMILVLVSLTASLGTALLTLQDARLAVESFESNTRKSSAEYRLQEAYIASLDRQVQVNTDRLATLPADFSTQARLLNEIIERTRIERETAVEILKGLGTSQTVQISTPTTIFDSLGKPVNTPGKTIEFILALILALIIEIGGLILAGSSSPTHPTRNQDIPAELSDCPTHPEATSQREDETVVESPIGRTDILPPVEVFFEGLKKDADLPYLNGRDRTAKLLGIPPYEAKMLINQLMSSGMIKSEGKRLKLVS